MKALLHFIFLSWLLTAIAPDVTTQTIAWNSSKVTQVVTGALSTEPVKLIIYQKERIEWIDTRGDKKYSLMIKSSNGSLQLDQPGEIIYQVSGENLGGNVTIRKTATQTIIKVVLVEAAKPVIYELAVNGFSVL